MALPQFLKEGDLDYIVFDYLAEITMSLLARARAKDPAAGYGTDFVRTTAALGPEIAARGVRVITNAGGVNPQACAEALRAAFAAQGVQLKIAVVEGDDLYSQAEALRAEGVAEMFSGAPMPAKLLSINAYLGAQPIAAALAAGADVVITGRCVDSAVTTGPSDAGVDAGSQDGGVPEYCPAPDIRVPDPLDDTLAGTEAYAPLTTCPTNHATGAACNGPASAWPWSWPLRHQPRSLMHRPWIDTSALGPGATSRAAGVKSRCSASASPSSASSAAKHG